MCTLINFCLRFLQGSANIPLFGDLASQWACLIMKLLNTVIIFLIMTHTASSSAPARRFVKKIQSPDYIQHIPQVVAVLLLVQLVNPFTSVRRFMLKQLKRKVSSSPGDVSLKRPCHKIFGPNFFLDSNSSGHVIQCTKVFLLRVLILQRYSHVRLWCHWHRLCGDIDSPDHQYNLYHLFVKSMQVFKISQV